MRRKVNRDAEVLGEAALRNLLLATTVQLGLWVFRIRRAQLLLVTWTVVLVASLAMPALQWATPVQFPIAPGDPAGWLISVPIVRSKLCRPRLTDLQRPSMSRHNPQ